MNAEELSHHVAACAAGKQRYIVAIVGPPGAGKSTLAAQLLCSLKEKKAQAKIIPMDGFHLDNRILSQRDLLARKGAADSFDGAGFMRLIERLARLEDDVAIPIFDREQDLSIAGADVISLQDQILLVEGNYLLLQKQPWEHLQQFWDETIFINPGLPVLEERLIKRWLDHGLDLKSAEKRARQNDIANAQYVIDNSFTANIQLL